MTLVDFKQKVLIAQDDVGLGKDATLIEIRDRLPASLSANGNLNININEDSVGLATELTLSAIKSAVDTILNAIGDAGTSPENVTGETVLKKLEDIALAVGAGGRALKASTTTALTANASYTSDAFDITYAAHIVGYVFADVGGDLYIEQSPDGSNWDIVETINVVPNKGMVFRVECVTTNARVRYVNGNTDQTVFRLYAYTEPL